MAYVPGTALLAALVVGCSASTGTGGSAPDSKPGEATVAAAAPGKYRTLPDPCRAVAPSTLKDLLPGAAELPEDQQKKVYEGTATVTYDTDRRVGCRWKSEAPDSSRTLFIDFERVVSYDPSVSDDDRAREVYAKKENAAGLSSSSAAPSSTKDTEKQAPPSSDSASDSASHALSRPASEDGNADEPTGGSPDENGSDSGTDGSAGSAGSADESLLPRTLDNLGDGAFLDDLPTRAGSTAQNRTVSVVFRTSNVIVTVEYTEQPTVSTVLPDSKELQDMAQSLARQLVDKFSE
ncbi:DUF3558 domain-containing protein [Streptomyces atratus]|uniref:DUF3558 domain-containing protein n=1 Tax=Streptomyces atratus TaxID=1893 RepID=UPI002AC31612|nr:DUF3558 domain-containing protein [Streptomyces atratus]WPW29610.1 DUF3558 domain-containing protein [Streptomyces atratus]